MDWLVWLWDRVFDLPDSKRDWRRDQFRGHFLFSPRWVFPGGAFVFLWPIVTHVIQRPSILNNQEGYPLGLIIDGEHYGSKNQSRCIYNKKQNIKKFLMSRFLFVIGYIQKPFPEFHVFIMTILVLFSKAIFALPPHHFKRSPIAPRQSFESGLHGLSTTESLDKIRTENEWNIPRWGMRTVGQGLWGESGYSGFITTLI